MANLDRPFGLRAITAGVAGTAPQITRYVVSSTLATQIGEGDILYGSALGPHALSTFTGTADQIHSIIGVAAHYVAATPGSGVTLDVYSDPDQLYEVQADDNTLNTVAELLEMTGQYAEATVGNANTLTGQSIHELDGDTVTSVRTEEEILQIVRPAKVIGNVVTSGSWLKVVVRFTRECLKYESHTATVMT